jgi:AcrR family transcriptional regulator
MAQPGRRPQADTSTGADPGLASTSLTEAAVERALMARRATSYDQAARLIDACVSVMQETGEFDPPVATILRRAGLPTKTLYRLFPSKTDLLLAVWEQLVGQTVRVVRERMAAARTPADQVMAWVNAMVDRLGDSSIPGTVPLPVVTPSYAARLHDDVTYPHPDLLAPLEEALAALARDRKVGTAVGEPPETAAVVFDVVMHCMIRVLVRGHPLTQDEHEVLDASVRRIVGLTRTR